MKRFLKIVVASVLTGILICTFGNTSFAYSTNESYRQYGEWIDNKAVNTNKLVRYLLSSNGDSWVLRSTDTYDFPAGSITMESYTYETGWEKHCKAVTTHSSNFYGYVRARYETLGGSVVSGADSGRVYSYYGATAETSYTGMSIAIAHTYCGVN